MEGEELIQAARAAIQDQGVAVAVRRAPALDRDVPRDWVRPAVALVGVVERDAHLALAALDDGDRDPDRSARPEARAEVGMDRLVEPDRADDGVGVRCDRQTVDALVPRIRLREDRATRRRRMTERLRSVAAEEEREGDDCDESGPHPPSIGR